MQEAMLHTTPQAHLRDLFRPVYSEAPVPLEQHEAPIDPGGRAAYAELRSALTREPLPVIGRVADTLDETRAACA